MQIFPFAERCVDPNGKEHILKLRRRKRTVLGSKGRHQIYGDFERVTEQGHDVVDNQNGTFTVSTTGEILTFVEYCMPPKRPRLSV